MVERSEERMRKVPCTTRILYDLTNWGLFVAGLLNLGIGTWAAATKGVGVAATSLTAGFVLLLAGTIDRFESLKGLGVEAKTRKLDEKIEQAKEILSRLKEVAELMGTALIDVNNRMGRWDSAPTPKESYQFAQKVRSIMEALGSEQDTIRSTLEPWAHTMCRDLARALIRPVEKAIHEETSKLLQERGRIQPPNVADPNWVRLTTAISNADSFTAERLGKVWEIPLKEYPERLQALFEDVPLVSADTMIKARRELERFSDGMRSIRSQFTLPEPEAWFAAIEDSTKP